MLLTGPAARSTVCAPPRPVRRRRLRLPECPELTQTRLGRERHECKFDASAINWLAKRPRWHVHLTPTSSSWLNQVERFFAHIAERKIRRGIYRSVAALRAEITSFIEYHNADPRPFRWTKSADDILSSGTVFP